MGARRAPSGDGRAAEVGAARHVPAELRPLAHQGSVHVPSIDGALVTLGADRVHAAGITGEGWTVVVVDGGVDPAFPLVAGKVVGGSAPAPPPRPGFAAPHPAGPWNAVERGAPKAVPPDDLNHGTQAAAAICAVAPGARVVSIRVEHAGRVPTDLVVRALEEVHRRWIHVEEIGRIAAVSISLGAGVHLAPCDGEDEAARALARAVGALAAVGVPVLAPLGNGNEPSAAFPACLAGVLGVGSTSRDGTRAAHHSNWSPLASFVAPGEDLGVPVPFSPLPFALEGTSIATPLVAGSIALLRQAFPDVPLPELLAALESTARPVLHDGVELPLVQARAALERLRARAPR